MQEEELERIKKEKAELQLAELKAKNEAAQKRKELEAKQKALEEEHALKEEEEAAAIKMQSMWRAKEAKDEVAKKKAQHAAEMEELRLRGVKEKELQALLKNILKSYSH